MMQQNLIDAARAVIAADRAGELTDELINALEKELTRAETPRGRGPYGVDTGYFDRKLARVIPALDNYTPADLAREFARMAAVADREAAFAELAPATEQSGEAVAVVDEGDDGMWADILPDRNVRWGQLLYAAPPVPPDALELLRIWQTWLGPDCESCDEGGKKLWDRIDAVLASKEPKHD